MPDLHLARAEALIYRVPLARPIPNSFGALRDRPTVLVRVEDRDGAVGWGEIWCNFPPPGAEHRGRLLRDIVAPLATARPFVEPEDLYEHLANATHVMAIQGGEPGPFAQVLAGVDIAVHDLAARLRGQPLWRRLGGNSPTIRCYASGLNPDDGAAVAVERRAEGHRAFKLKVGFGRERDLANVRGLRAALGPDAELMVDANQAWDVATAHDMARVLEEFNLAWLEEPLAADRPLDEWRALADATPIPLAAGENLRGEAEFGGAIASGAIRVVQPDIAKWGGFTGCFRVARAALAAGRRYCPHFLGGGIGLVASAHLLAAAGGDGLLEVDSNANPMQRMMFGPALTLADGRVTLNARPGLGVEPDLAALERWRVKL
jgi:L-alanine-DL-glutamate epimerase-like enolase superfamily enzyme